MPMRMVIAAALALLPTATRAAEPQADAELVKTAQSVFKELQTHTLDNGLRVYLAPVKGSPVVSVMVAYRVGSCD
jgi:zinc protease